LGSGWVTAATIVAIPLTACAVQRAETARVAKEQMVGLPKEKALACMGPPANQMTIRRAAFGAPFSFAGGGRARPNWQNSLWTLPRDRRKIPNIRTQVRCRLLGERVLAMKSGLMFTSAIFALMSAGCWICACFVRMRVSYRPQVGADGWIEASITTNGADFFRKVEHQMRWNAAASRAAAVAALCQAALIFC
jgi:hypothetical protein